MNSDLIASIRLIKVIHWMLRSLNYTAIEPCRLLVKFICSCVAMANSLWQWFSVGLDVIFETSPKGESFAKQLLHKFSKTIIFLPWPVHRK